MAVKRARSLKGWKLDDLARAIAQMPGATPGSTVNTPGKSFLSDIEKGKRSISPSTVGKLIFALGLPQTWIDRFADSDTAPEAEENRVDRDADRLVQMLARNAPDVPAPEDLLIGLAQDFAGKGTYDTFTAFESLKKALMDTADLKAQGLLPSNTGDQLSLILRRVSDLNDQGLRDEAGAALDAAIARNEAEAGALFDAALKQDRIRNRPKDAATRLIAHLHRQAPPGGVVRATFDLIEEWRDRGHNGGLLFHLQVAMCMALTNVERAKGASKASAVYDLALCQPALGQRSVTDAALNAALRSIDTCLGLSPREAYPNRWATAQHVLGDILEKLGDRHGHPAFLERSVAAYNKAMLQFSWIEQPVNRRITMNGLGVSLQGLGWL